jgi:uncharacterized protein
MGSRGQGGTTVASRDVQQRILAAAALVEDRLDAPLSVAEMAETACYSIFHFSRLFTAVAGFSPYDYLMRRRLSASVEPLMAGTQPITQIALSHGFDSPEGYSRAFRRMFGMLPSDARRSGEADDRLRLRPLDERRAAVLASLHPGPPQAFETDTAFQVRVTSGASAAEALGRLCETLQPEDRVIGMCSGRAVQAFAGEPAAADGRPETGASGGATGDAPDRSSDGYFQITRPAGSYHAVRFAGTAAELATAVELLYSTLWPRLAARDGTNRGPGSATVNPPPVLFAELADQYHTLLLPAAAAAPERREHESQPAYGTSGGRTVIPCRRGCAACCVAPSISSPLPGMPHGKPAGVVCVNLDARTRECRIWGTPEYPEVCRAFTATTELCGASRDQALQRLAALERETQPEGD